MPLFLVLDTRQVPTSKNPSQSILFYIHSLYCCKPKFLSNEALAVTPASCQHLCWAALNRPGKNPSKWAPASGGVSTRLGKISSQVEEVTPDYHSSETGRKNSSPWGESAQVQVRTSRGWQGPRQKGTGATTGVSGVTTSWSHRALGFLCQAASYLARMALFFCLVWWVFFLRIWQFCVRGGGFKEPGMNWLFLDQYTLVEGDQVRWRQQLQQLSTEVLPPEGYCCHVPLWIRGVLYFWG